MSYVAHHSHNSRHLVKLLVLKNHCRYISSQRKYKTHYEILGLSPDASQDSIKKAFLTLSKELHPDTNSGNPDSHSNFVRLNEAYSVLSKPLSRREYDLNLAHALYIRQNMARNAYTSHMPGSSYSSGVDTDPEYSGREQSERMFWDETIWHMRDKRKDASAFYEDDNYYGIKGVRRLPNSYILAGCLSLVVIGWVYFYFGLKWSLKRQRERIERVDKVNLRYLKEAEERARINGFEKQLAILRQKMEAKEKAMKSKPS